MKFSKVSALSLSLIGIVNASVVYQTAHYHVTVTAGANDNNNVASVGLPSSTNNAQANQQQPQAGGDEQQKQQQQQPQTTVVTSTYQGGQQNKNQEQPTSTEQQQQQPSSGNVDPSSQGEEAIQTPNPSATGDTNIGEYAKKCINKHNDDRSKHSAPKMSWNQTLADYAKKYLQNQNCVFAHSGGPYGENIAMGYDSAEDAIKAWYDEYKSYNFKSGQFSEGTGHFTQMVWKSSEQIGCADVDCGSKGKFMACEYFPRGNVAGQFVDNVLSS